VTLKLPGVAEALELIVAPNEEWSVVDGKVAVKRTVQFTMPFGVTPPSPPSPPPLV